MVAQMVTPGNRVADIGCDHGYVSIYIVLHSITNKVIAMDVNKGPLQKAQDNIEEYHVSKEIETRLSDGGKELKEGEVDTIIISGMGGTLMSRILNESSQVVYSCSELILQPQSEIHLVRRTVQNCGFSIIYEEMLVEDGKYYTGIKASRNSKIKDIPLYTETDYRYGRYLLEKRDMVLNEYLLQEYSKIENVIKELGQSFSEKGKLRTKELQHELEYIREGLKYYEM